MKVWIAEQGAYENCGIVGVYATAELAMDAHPIPADFKYPDHPTAGNMSRRGGWRQDSDGNWDNGLDWDAGVSVRSFEVITTLDSSLQSAHTFSAKAE